HALGVVVRVDGVVARIVEGERADRGKPRHAGVTAAVLGGVTEHYQGRGRPAAAVDRNGVAAAAAVHDGERAARAIGGGHGAADGQVVVAAAEHDLDRLDVEVIDPAGEIVGASLAVDEVQVATHPVQEEVAARQRADVVGSAA